MRPTHSSNQTRNLESPQREKCHETEVPGEKKQRLSTTEEACQGYRADGTQYRRKPALSIQ